VGVFEGDLIMTSMGKRTLECNRARSAGMKKHLWAATAVVVGLIGVGPLAKAADLPVRAPAYVAPVFSWTGFYIGGNIGGAWAQRDVTDSVLGLNFDNGTSNGVFIGGGQIGGNYQVGNFVRGVEGDFDWAANNKTTNSAGAVPTDRRRPSIASGTEAAPCGRPLFSASATAGFTAPTEF